MGIKRLAFAEASTHDLLSTHLADFKQLFVELLGLAWVLGPLRLRNRRRTDENGREYEQSQGHELRSGTPAETAGARPA